MYVITGYSDVGMPQSLTVELYRDVSLETKWSETALQLFLVKSKV